MTNPEGYSPGLEGVIGGITSIATVENGLCYRGYPVEELVKECNFEEVAFLLLYGELPTAREYNEFASRVYAARRLTLPIRDFLKAIPKWTMPLDALRTAVSALAHSDQDVEDNTREGNLRKGERLIAQLPVAIADHYRFSKGLQPIQASQELSQAANFLYMIRGSEPSPEDTKAMDVSLILYAEHEFNASTFTARTIVSTESDLHSAVVGGIGALKGKLHGGANEKVMPILEAIGSKENAESWVMASLQRKERLMGFGHRVYKKGDVRASILKPYARQLAEQKNLMLWEEIAEIVEEVMAREKKMYPNLDWPAGRLYHAMGLEIPIYTPIFAMSRVAGWSAHVIEQLGNNRLIRPRALYQGPPLRSVKPMDQRN